MWEGDGEDEHDEAGQSSEVDGEVEGSVALEHRSMLAGHQHAERGGPEAQRQS